VFCGDTNFCFSNENPPFYSKLNSVIKDNFFENVDVQVLYLKFERVIS